MTDREAEVSTPDVDKKTITATVDKTKTVQEVELRESLQLLQKTIKDWHHEVDFTSNAFVGHANQTQSSLASTNTSMQETLKTIAGLLSAFSESSTKIQDQTITLALLPQKVHKALEDLVPNIGREVEKIHSQRLEIITTHIAKIEQALKDSIMQNQKAIEETARLSIRQMQEAQLNALESQRKQIAEFVKSVKEEVEAVTSNHGSKFLRNLIITLILATIAGGITSWCVGKYFPAFIQINKAGDVTVQHSAVKIWEADHPKINDSNKKTKVVK
jgi:hypothetical protein